VRIAEADVPALPEGMRLSGADIEGIVTRARRLAMVEGVETVTPAHLKVAAEQFLPSAESAEKALQEVAAVLECTDVAFLPAEYLREGATPNSRLDLLARYRALSRAV